MPAWHKSGGFGSRKQHFGSRHDLSLCKTVPSCGYSVYSITERKGLKYSSNLDHYN